MTTLSSSCETGNAPQVSASGSRIHRFQAGYRWTGVPVAEYKAPANHWCGIQRMMLVGEQGEATKFHLRYFEIAPGGFSSLEHHAHEHVVIVFRGCGEVQLGDGTHSLGVGDTVYVAPHEVHQFRNPSGSEPFGFFCMVDAKRDVPVPVDSSFRAPPSANR